MPLNRLAFVSILAAFLAAACHNSPPAPAVIPAHISAVFPAPKDLPIQTAMPDPLTMNDGQKVTTPAQWRQRREEMKAILEEYEYGHMPPPPGNVKGREVVASHAILGGRATYRMVHLTFGPDEKLGFDVGIFSPAGSDAVKAPFPTMIALSFSAAESGAAQYQTALTRGYAIAAIGYTQLGADNVNFRQTAFFPAYPAYDWNDISAWAWGISRCVDFLQIDRTTDKDKLLAMGVSRTGQAVLLAGAFDERIALVAPVGGGMAFRYSGVGRGGKQGIDEVVDQNTYWFGPKFPQFKGRTDNLPCDQHWLLALAAPRAYLLCNAFQDQYGNPNAALQSYIGAKPVYALLGADDNLGINFRSGQHGMNAADRAAILDFADVKLKNQKASRRFDVIPTPEQLR